MWLRICPHCKQQTPGDQKVCVNCGHAPSSDLFWKVPLIVLLFVVAFAIAIAINR